MKLIIDIPEKVYDKLLTEQRFPPGFNLEYPILHGVPVPREKAHWFFSETTFTTVCSNCGEGEWKGYIPTPTDAGKWMPFCPKCGPEMEGEDESSN